MSDSVEADARTHLSDVLHRLTELAGLIPNSTPTPIDRNIDEQCELRKFTPQRQRSLATEEVNVSSSSHRASLGEDKSLFTYFIECYTKHYADFSGRARRREYWGTVLFNILSYLLLVFISSLLFGVLGAVQGSLNQTLQTLQSMVLFLLLVCSVLPGLAVAVRRLHDTGRSGLYYLLIFIPILGPILLLFWMCSDSQPEENEYGPNPKA